MARRKRWSDREFFPESVPREAKGGIKAQSRRGSFGSQWWAKRWNSVLESLLAGGRLTRGRKYARQGQVLSIEINKGRVTAEVQGSRPRPYTVELRVRVLSEKEWKRIAEALSEEALVTAKLVGGEMPEEVESLFERGGGSLFPESRKELSTHCSCPDSSNPCKHIAAVYYLIGEEFDRDPFLIFKLRGKQRQELVKQLSGGGETGKTENGKKAPSGIPAEGNATEERAEPLPTDPDAFWGRGGELPSVQDGLSPPKPAAPVVKRLGNFPFWRGEGQFMEIMESLYETAGTETRERLFEGGNA